MICSKREGSESVDTGSGWRSDPSPAYIWNVTQLFSVETRLEKRRDDGATRPHSSGTVLEQANRSNNVIVCWEKDIEQFESN